MQKDTGTKHKINQVLFTITNDAVFKVRISSSNHGGAPIDSQLRSIHPFTAPRRALATQGESKMVNMTTFFGMSLGAFVFWQSMDKVHVWIALHQDEKKERMEKEAEIRRVRELLIQENKEREPIA
ncbi:hypothetical protein LXL04_025792 [Taraxacum kok-saghyz]